MSLAVAIQCITLDLDNTLWDVESVMVRAEKEIRLWAEREMPQVLPVLNDFKRLMAMRDELIAQQPVLGIDLGRLRLSLYRTALAHTGTPPEQVDAEAERIFAQHKLWRNRVVLYEGVQDGLEWLAGRMKVGAITNGNADLELAGLGEYFDFALNPAATGSAKPDPAMFIAAQKVAGIPAGEIVHMGDSAELDVEAARNAGFQGLWFNPGDEPWPLPSPPPPQIAHWSELPAALERL